MSQSPEDCSLPIFDQFNALESFTCAEAARPVPPLTSVVLHYRRVTPTAEAQRGEFRCNLTIARTFALCSFLRVHHTAALSS
jgi:hypothetical protein